MRQLKIETPTEVGPENSVESLGWQLRAGLPPLRLHCVAIFDRSAEVLWLSESVLGPDEQGFVAEALSEFEAQPAAAHCQSDFLDGRGAVFLPLRAEPTQLVGLVMIVVDARTLATGNLPARVATAAVRDVLERLGQELPSPAPMPGQRPETLERAPTASDADDPAATASPTTLDAFGETTVDILAPERVDEILTFELSPDSLAGGPPEPAAAPAVESPPEAPTPEVQQSLLRIEELAKLRPGGRLRRFQVVSQAVDAGASSAAADDLLARIAELRAWLDSPTRPQHTPLNFSFPLTVEALSTEDLPERIRDSLGSSGSRPADIGLELAESLYLSHRERIDRLLEVLEHVGSFLVIDDFTFDSRALELLRSKAVRLVKVHPRLIGAALRDKLAQARIVAICQASKVLGIHCAAKHVEEQGAKRWLTAAGFDFAQGPLFDPPWSLDSLAAQLAQG